jgi:hypothetical protein
VWSGVESGVRSGVESGVRSGVESGDLLAPWAEWLHEPIRQGLDDARSEWARQYRGGNLWCSWEAWATWFRDIGHLDLPGDLWDRLKASEDMTLAGPSWWYEGLCVVSDRPTVLHLESAGGQTRLHCETGPAVAWADGWGVYAWHGTVVPADLIETGWSTDRILREPNAEIRRCAVEVVAGRDGWAEIVTQAGWAQVGRAVPDPGNPGQDLTLWHVPAEGASSGGLGLYAEPVRLLLCTNGTPDRGGRRHQFGLTVPATINDPLAAAAWGYGLRAEQYATAQVRR